LTDKEKLLFVRGVGERTVQLLEDAGYRSVEDILREDEDKLAIKTGLGIKKARALKQGAEQFLGNEWKQIDAARKAASSTPKEGATAGARRRRWKPRASETRARPPAPRGS